MVQVHPSQKNQIAIPSNRVPNSDARVCVLVRDRLVSLLPTMVVVVVSNGRVANMLTEHRRGNLGSIRRILVGD